MTKTIPMPKACCGKKGAEITKIILPFGGCKPADAPTINKTILAKAA